MSRMNELYKKMIAFDKGDAKRIQHFTKVHNFARLIGQEEHLDEKTQYILEAAALVHDIGIRPAMEKYGNCNGKLQEQEGPAYAEEMLKGLGFAPDVIERVAYLVGHHHTYTDIDGLDYQILVEADFLVNYFEDGLDEESIKASVKKIFRTETGKTIARDMFYPEEFQMSETWAQDGLQDLEDWIEEQGIYIRQ
ncbi:HD domain-containing protein [Blautia sp. HCP3S3_G3]|uniref:HD domain-containing protein n=1 Tax=Blautia sp. HCP3S3_G3 TaxID=3438913 RepID=UPI003F89814C